MKRNSPKINKYLNRYTSLPFLLDLLQNRGLTLVDPKNWEDKNDTSLIELYKKSLGYESVFALCFSGFEGRDAEKYHIWKTYSGSSSGVGVQFESNKLLPFLKRFDEEIEYGMVDYLTIREFESKSQQKAPEDLPFMKRKAYDCDHEFRIIYRSTSKEENPFFIPIDLACISRITLNPWLLEPIDKSVQDFINEITEYKNINFVSTTVLEYKRWIKCAQNIANKED